MTHTTDPLLAIDRSLTDDEREQFLAYVARRWPNLVGAEPADVLELTTSHDMFLAQTEPFWEEHAAELPDGAPVTAVLHALIILGAELTVENLTRMLTAAGLMPEPEATRVTEVRMAYDPIPDLAALVDGLEAVASAGTLGSPNSVLLEKLGYLLTGPYARLRGGLLLDEPGHEAESTEQAIREALRGYITPAGKLITTEEIRGWVDEAERGYDLTDDERAVGGILRQTPHAAHTPDGPLDCPRCQLLRENAHWMDHMLEPHRHSHEGAASGPMAAEPHVHLHTHLSGTPPTPVTHDHEHRHAERGHDIPEGYYRDATGLHRQHDVFGGPHDERT